MLSDPTHVVAKATKGAMAPAMEAGVAAMPMGARLLAERRQASGGMGRPQPAAVVMQHFAGARIGSAGRGAAR